MSDGPNPGSVLAGIFLIMCGLCVAVLGGGCTIMMLPELGNLFQYGGILFLALSVMILCAGLATIWLGIRMFRGPGEGGG